MVRTGAGEASDAKLWQMIHLAESYFRMYRKNGREEMGRRSYLFILPSLSIS